MPYLLSILATGGISLGVGLILYSILTLLPVVPSMPEVFQASRYFGETIGGLNSILNVDLVLLLFALFIALVLNMLTFQTVLWVYNKFFLPIQQKLF